MGDHGLELSRQREAKAVVGYNITRAFVVADTDYIPSSSLNQQPSSCWEQMRGQRVMATCDMN